MCNHSITTTSDFETVLIMMSFTVLNRKGAGLAPSLAKGVDILRGMSLQVQIVACMVPEVPVCDTSIQ